MGRSHSPEVLSKCPGRDYSLHKESSEIVSKPEGKRRLGKRDFQDPAKGTPGVFPPPQLQVGSSRACPSLAPYWCAWSGTETTSGRAGRSFATLSCI